MTGSASVVCVYLDMSNDDPSRVTTCSNTHITTPRTQDEGEVQCAPLFRVEGADVVVADVAASTTVGFAIVAVLATEAGRPCERDKGGVISGARAHTLTSNKQWGGDRGAVPRRSERP